MACASTASISPATRPVATVELRATPLGMSVIRAGARPLATGLFSGLVICVKAAWWLRPELVLDSEVSWVLPRLLLGLGVLGIGSAAAVLTAVAMVFLERRTAGLRLVGLPFGGAATGLVLLAALTGGVLVRAVSFDQRPWPLWVDDTSLIPSALGLSETGKDFRLVHRAPDLPGPAGGSVGVLYLQVLRWSLELWGTNVLGLRFPSLLGGSLSLLTAAWLGWRLLPRGGAALTALILAGLRWSLIESRWGWISILLAPVVDVAGILMVRARRKESNTTAVASGIVAGVGAHLYLAAWVAAAGIGLFALWTPLRARGSRLRLSLALCFALGFALVVMPLLVGPFSDSATYFSRAAQGHFWMRDLASEQAPAVVAAVIANGLVAPWLSDPIARHDLTDRSRLGLVVGLLLAFGITWTVMQPRREVSAFLLAHGAAALCGVALWGPRGQPNGFRYGYLTTVLSIGAAAGGLWLLSLVRQRARRTASLVLLGVVLWAGAGAIGDTLGTWAGRRETFDSFSGADTLLGREAARWERVGSVAIEMPPSSARFMPMIQAVQRFRLDPDDRTVAGLSRRPIAFRIVEPGFTPEPKERKVGTIRDGWGRDWGIVLARPAAETHADDSRATSPHLDDVAIGNDLGRAKVLRVTAD